MDAMAVVYARELVRWGVESTIVVPGAFTGGTNHFAHSAQRTIVPRAIQVGSVTLKANPYQGGLTSNRCEAKDEY